MSENLNLSEQQMEELASDYFGVSMEETNAEAADGNSKQHLTLLISKIWLELPRKSEAYYWLITSISDFP